MRFTTAIVLAMVALLAITVVAQPKKTPAVGLTCPVSGEAVKDLKRAPSVQYEGRTIYLCCRRCVGTFNSNPMRYASKQLVRCPVSGEVVKDPAKAQTSVHQNRVYYFCCAKCRPQFDKEPAKYARQQKAPSASPPSHEGHSHSH